MPNVNICTFNVRGLRSADKRRTVFRYFHEQFPNHIMVLQETHSIKSDERYWQAEWGGPIMFSHGSGRECGVAILIPRSIDKKYISEMSTDDAGRLIFADLKYERFSVKLVALYAPTQGHADQQYEFYSALRRKVEEMTQMEQDHLIICGDTNIQMSNLDTSNSNRFRLTAAGKVLLKLLDDYHLVDIWRNKYPEARRYTWRRVAPIQQSRIDCIFASKYLLNNHILRRAEIKPGILSDHSIVNMEITMFADDKGPGLFRFRCELLQDNGFTAAVRDEITKATHGYGIYNDVNDHGLKLELLLSEVRVISIKRGKAIATERREESAAAYKWLEICELEISNSPSNEAIQKFTEAKQRVDEIESEKGKRAMLYSGAKWMEEGEKPTKYFFSLCASRNAKKQINVLQAENGDIITGNKPILDYCKAHFEKIYASRMRTDRENGGLCESFLGTAEYPKLSETERDVCDAPITGVECKEALDGMMNNKAPSTSGFPKEFFHFFWTELESIVLNVVHEAKERGQLFITQRRGVITLIPKKGDQKLVKNKRAICLLDVVYKIIAKVIANRMANVLNKLIDSDQTGSIRGRFIGTNLRTVDDVIKYGKIEGQSGIIMALDFQNAFNTVEHNFIYDTLKKFNFGDSFVDWIKLLHKGAELAVINNGHTSSWFQPSRGLQQGCPASALLFTLVVEIMAIKLRAAASISGVHIAGREFRLSQYCDDTTIFVKDVASAREAIRITEQFGGYSGLQLNMDKCQFMWIGEERNSDALICGHTPVKELKILGVRFSSVHDCEDSNILPILTKIQNTLDRWLQRDLTIKGRITIAKSLVVSQLIYILSAACISKKYLDIVQSKIMRFIWRGRPPKVARKTLYQKVEVGGLNAPNILAIYKSMRAAWMAKIVTNKAMTFAKVFLEKVHIDICDITNIAYHKGWIRSRPIIDFYKEMLIWFSETFPMKPPADGNAVRRQIIWYNKDICIDRNVVCYKRLYKNGIKYIDDITDTRGQILSHQNFVERHRVRPGPLQYMSLIRAIPRNWKRLLAGSETIPQEERRLGPRVEMDGKLVPIQTIKSSYYHLTWIESHTPCCQSKWESEPIILKGEWKDIYLLPFKITSSTKLQSLQYRILHRYFPTRKFLCTRGVTDDPFCNECGEVETIQHFFVTCNDNEMFWNKISAEINQRVEPRHHFHANASNIIFGALKNRKIVNLIVLIAKQYIVKQRFKEERLIWDEFKAFLTRFFHMEKINANKKGKIETFKEKWSPFVTPNVQINI